MSRTRLLVVGVDGMDHDVVLKLGPERLPHLHRLVSSSKPHSSTFPPDSVPSWTTMLTGVPPWEHGQLHSKNYILDKGAGPEVAGLRGLEDRCFWNALPTSARLAVINPFLAYPAFEPLPGGAMVSAPSFSEQPPSVVDRERRLVGEPPARMGGFTNVPQQKDIAAFGEDTRDVAAEQFTYTLAQLDSGQWDAVFHTNLTVDRIQHFAWRHFDPSDPTHPGSEYADLVPAAYRQVDDFLSEASSLCAPDAQTVVFSDHGHGPRASVGINLQEVFRREGLYVVSTTAARRTVETAKTALLSYAPACHAEDPVIWLARRMPGKAALKSGAVAGRPVAGSIKVPNVAGSNPYGGVATGGDDGITSRVVELLESLEHRGRRVAKWVRTAEAVLGTADVGPHYPDVLFELLPAYAPTWNLYGPAFAPIITRKRLSGGHTRRSVFATTAVGVTAPADSAGVHAALREVCSQL